MILTHRLPLLARSRKIKYAKHLGLLILRAFKWKMDICYLAQLAQMPRLGAQVAQAPRSEHLERGQDIRCLRKLGDPGRWARYGVWGFLTTPTNTPLFEQSLILNPTTYWPGIKLRRNW